jgi:hypothetical protein
MSQNCGKQKISIPVPKHLGYNISGNILMNITWNCVNSRTERTLGGDARTDTIADFHKVVDHTYCCADTEQQESREQI